MNHKEQIDSLFQKTFRVSQNYIHKKIADMDIFISIGSNIANFNGYIKMNPSAVSLWEALQSPCNVNDLTNTLEQEYGLSNEEATQDVVDFLKVLIEHKMVEVQ